MDGRGGERRWDKTRAKKKRVDKVGTEGEEDRRGKEVGGTRVKKRVEKEGTGGDEDKRGNRRGQECGEKGTKGGGGVRRKEGLERRWDGR